MSDTAADRIAADLPIPFERGYPLRPYLSVEAGAYRVGFWPNAGRGPVSLSGPAFPLTRAGCRSASALAAAIERRLDRA